MTKMFANNLYCEVRQQNHRHTEYSSMIDESERDDYANCIYERREQKNLDTNHHNIGAQQPKTLLISFYSPESHHSACLSERLKRTSLHCRSAEIFLRIH